MGFLEHIKEEETDNIKVVTLHPLAEAFQIVTVRKMNPISGAGHLSQKMKNSLVKSLAISVPVFIKSDDECSNIEIIAKGSKKAFTVRISELDGNMYIY